MSITLFDQIKIKHKHKNTKGCIVLIRQGNDYITYRQDAELLSQIFRFKTELADQVLYTSFDESYLDLVVNTCLLRMDKKVYATEVSLPTMEPEFAKEIFETGSVY